jgi:hypothetical protein
MHPLVTTSRDLGCGLLLKPPVLLASKHALGRASKEPTSIRRALPDRD